jgi:hypothetical protein
VVKLGRIGKLEAYAREKQESLESARHLTRPFTFRDVRPSGRPVGPSASGEAVVGEPASLASKRFGFADSRKAKRECLA